MNKEADPRNRTFFLAQKAYAAWLDGHSFIPHVAELLASPAWRHRSWSAMRFIDRLELEHARHNGLENGHLKLTYRQMQEAGIHSDYIADTIDEVEALGLVTVTHRGAYRGGARNNPSTYRLNYLPWKFVPASGAPVYYAPNDEWASYAGKSAREKSIRMHHTGGASSPYTGGAFKAPAKSPIPANSAKVAEPVNAPPGWMRSSILRSTDSIAVAPPSALPGVSTPGTVVTPQPRSTSQHPQRPSRRRTSL
jgi:hypothetical protein